VDLAGTLSGRSPASLPDTTQFKDVASFAGALNELETRLLTFVRGLTQTDLDRVMEYKTLKYGVYSNPLWQSMQHLVNHGKLSSRPGDTLLRQLGAQPILTDLMHFLPRTRDGGGRVVPNVFLTSWNNPNHAWMKEAARQARAESRIIGLVPTMALFMLDICSLIDARGGSVRR